MRASVCVCVCVCMHVCVCVCVCIYIMGSREDGVLQLAFTALEISHMHLRNCKQSRAVSKCAERARTHSYARSSSRIISRSG